MPVMMFIGNLNYVLIAVLGGLRVASGSMSLGDVQAFIQYSRQFTQPLTQLASMVNLLQSGVASAERVFELLDAEEEPLVTPTPAPAADGRRGRVVVRRRVRSPTTPTSPLIEDLSLTVRPGQTVAIVGPRARARPRWSTSSCGSTTSTAAGSPWTGWTSRRCERSDAALPDRRWCSRTPGSSRARIRDNIAYGRPDATEEEILEAARATFVDRFVHTLPEGYDTVIDENGANLSRR